MTALYAAIDDGASRPRVAELLRPLCTHVWEVADGQETTHTVYSLIGCPPPEAALSYLLVRRDGSGKRQILAARRASPDEAPSLRLAAIRREGAMLGANEVHFPDEATAPLRQ